MEACYHSASRSTFAEDIQNICTAFEALLEVSKKGDSAKQVSEQLRKLFTKRALSRVQKKSTRTNTRERKEVMKGLDEWVGALYQIRNAYTHGKSVRNYVFGERSVWQDSFEIFRLSANRKILSRPEPCPPSGSALEKRLMSVVYFDQVVRFISKKGPWMIAGRKRLAVATLKEVITKARTLDPELVESIAGVGSLQQGLFNLFTATFNVLERSSNSALLQIRDAMHKAFRECRNDKGGLDMDAYLRVLAPRLPIFPSGLPFAGNSIRLYEVIDAIKALLTVYGNFTKPILNRISAFDASIYAE